jgi:hypothetical protein
MRLSRSPFLVAISCWASLHAALPLSMAATADTREAQPVSKETPVASPAPVVAGAATGQSLDRARALIKDGQYDEAIETLRASIDRARAAPAMLRDAYLLLIKTYVFLGNDLKFRPQGREASNLNYQEAKKLIAECLGIEALRHTQPEPASEYPPEMIAFFSEVRSRSFGSFRVVDLKPAGSVVFLDGDTLRAMPGDSLPGDVDLKVGPHRVAVFAKGHRALSQEIIISPNAVLERSYRLARKRGAVWYTSASGVAAALVLGIFAIGKGSAAPPGGLEPLPTAPDPPTR